MTKKKKKLNWKASKRVYGGQTYTRQRTMGYYPRKAQAEAEARRWREKGAPARIGRVADQTRKGVGGWGVWVNREKTFKGKFRGYRRVTKGSKTKDIPRRTYNRK